MNFRIANYVGYFLTCWKNVSFRVENSAPCTFLYC